MMKRLVVAVLIFGSVILTGCGNMEILDTTYKFDYVSIKAPDGSTIDGKCDKWVDYQDSDVVQVTIDGVTYLTHYSNVLLYTK